MNDIIKDKYIETTKRKNLSSYSLKKSKNQVLKRFKFHPSSKYQGLREEG